MNIKDFAAILAVSTLLSTSSYAQTSARTTPVEVKNSISIDQSNNTVKTQQSGAWSVGVTGTPNVIVSNTPTVNLGNDPTVKIDSTANVVKTPTQSSLIRLWTSPLTIATGSFSYSNTITTSGYKEMRVMIKSYVANGSYDKLSVRLDIFAFYSSWSVGTANFATPAHTVTDQGNFVQSPYLCMFSVPIYGDTYRICVRNDTGADVTIDSVSLVYLVN